MRTQDPVQAPLLCGAILLASAGAQAERLKDLASIGGVRQNQLIGLRPRGRPRRQRRPDHADAVHRAERHQRCCSSSGVNLPPGTSLQLKNVAAVMVTASLPAFAQPGQPLDVTVSSMGNAKSLRGGTLLMTPLKGADGQVYAHGAGQRAGRRRRRRGRRQHRPRSIT